MVLNQRKSIKLITKVFRLRPGRDSTNRSFAVGKRKKCSPKILGGVHQVVSAENDDNRNYDVIPFESTLGCTVDMNQKQQLEATSIRTLSTMVDSTSHETEAWGSNDDDGDGDDAARDGGTSGCSSKKFVTKGAEQQESSISDWISSGSSSHHVGAPLLARSQRNLFEGTTTKQYLALSDEEIIGRIMLRARKLPKPNPRYLISNHIMINNERTKRTRVPLQRNPVLDDIARRHAIQMASQKRLFHPSLDSVVLENFRRKTKNKQSNSSTVYPKQTLSLISGTWQGNHINSSSEPRRDNVISLTTKNNCYHENYDDHNNHGQRQLRRTRLGVNVGCGSNVNDIHRAMTTSKSDLNNIIDRRFVYMCVGTVRGTDGDIYLCQIFGD